MTSLELSAFPAADDVAFDESGLLPIRLPGVDKGVLILTGWRWGDCGIAPSILHIHKGR